MLVLKSIEHADFSSRVNDEYLTARDRRSTKRMLTTDWQGFCIEDERKLLNRSLEIEWRLILIKYQ